MRSSAFLYLEMSTDNWIKDSYIKYFLIISSMWAVLKKDKRVSMLPKNHGCLVRREGGQIMPKFSQVLYFQVG